jgi:hypothetical protein
MTKKPSKVEKALYEELKGLVACLRNFELGDYSPLMDEIFDSEYVVELYEKKYGLRNRLQERNLAESKTRNK